jgi:hypothetical protein
MRLSLRPHSSTPCASLTSVEVKILRLPGAALELHYFAMGSVRDIEWSVSAKPERLDRLWEESCFELFVQPLDRRSYVEFNFAPSSCWASYQFGDYRSGMQIVPVPQPPSIATRATDKSHVLTAKLTMAQFRGFEDSQDWQIGLSAVIEEKSTAKSYWALNHPVGKPDFHHKDCFALTLPAPNAL